MQHIEVAAGIIWRGKRFLASQRLSDKPLEDFVKSFADKRKQIAAEYDALRAVGSTPTVMNAVMDALWPLGVRNVQMPATPQRVWQAIQDSRQDSHKDGRK